MKKVPKICLVTDGTMPVPPVKGGAVSTLIKFLADENEKYKRVKFYIFSPYDKDAEKQAAKYKYSKFIFIQQNTKAEDTIAFISRIFNKVSKIIRHDEISVYNKFYRKCLKKVIKINPDYVVCEGGPMIAAFHCFSEYFLPEKLCLHLHGKWHPSRMVSSMFRHVIGCSEFIEKEYKAVCTKKDVHYGVVYNCSDNVRFKNRLTNDERKKLRQELGFENMDFVVVFCGRICADKGVRELIESVLMSGPRVKALIIGSVNFGKKVKKDAYQEQISRLASKNSQKIKVIGYIPNKRIWKYHQCGDCMAVPSIWDEPASLSLIEGLTSGLPMVVSRSGGIPEEVDEKCAFVIDRGDGMVKSMSDAFNRLSRDKKLAKRMSKAAERHSAFFSMEKFYWDYIDFFRTERNQ